MDDDELSAKELYALHDLLASGEQTTPQLAAVAAWIGALQDTSAA